MSEVELPQGWVKAKVGDYLYLKNGFAFKSNAYVDKTESTYPVIRISDIDGMYASDKDAVHVSTPMAGFEVSEGDLLIAMSGATTGKVGVYKGISPAFQNQRVGNLKLHSDKLGCRAYRNYLITALSGDILKVAYGGAQPNISGKAIEDMDIQLPPLAEQQVIADKLDTLLAQVESIKSRLERIPEILKQFRQSVLAAAVSDQESDVKALLDVADKITDGEHITPKTVEIGVPLLSAKDVQEKELIFSSCKYLERNIADKALARCNPRRNDILIVSRGATVGRTHLVSVDDEFCLMGSVLLIKLNKSLVHPQYMELVFKSLDGQRQLLAASGSSAQQAIYIRDVKSFTFPLPSIETQSEVVARVESWFSKANAIEMSVQSALDRVNNLTQSILAKAFRGELTAEWREANPELISGENSAEALLERIKAERSAKSVTKRGRAKT